MTSGLRPLASGGNRRAPLRPGQRVCSRHSGAAQRHPKKILSTVFRGPAYSVSPPSREPGPDRGLREGGGYPFSAATGCGKGRASDGPALPHPGAAGFRRAAGSPFREWERASPGQQSWGLIECGSGNSCMGYRTIELRKALYGRLDEDAGRAAARSHEFKKMSERTAARLPTAPPHPGEQAEPASKDNGQTRQRAWRG